METTTETPARRTMRQWFQGRQAMELLQGGQLAQKTEMLLRGARKQQDGTLGEPSGDEVDAEASDMRIRVGDETHHHYHEALVETEPPVVETKPEKPTIVDAKPSPPLPTAPSTLGKLLLPMALATFMGTGVGVGIPWLMGAFNRPPPVTAPADTDTDTISPTILS